MNVFIEMATLLLGIGIYCCWYDPEQKDGAEKMAYFHSCRYCSGLISVFLFICTIWLCMVSISRNRKQSLILKRILPVMTGARSGRTLKICIWTMQELSFSVFPRWIVKMAMLYMTAQVVPERAVFVGAEKEADDMSKIQLKDLDNDGIKEIGISMTDGQVLWYHYREELKCTWPENKGGCFEKLIKKLTIEKSVIMG